MKNLLGIGSVVNCEAIKEHSHTVWEMIYYLKGDVTLTMGGVEHDLTAGIFVCQPPYKTHSERGRSRFDNYHFSVSEYDLLPSRELIIKDTADEAIKNQIQQMYFLFRTKPANYQRICEGLLHLIVQYVLGQLQSGSTADPYVEKYVMLLLSNASNSAFQLSDISLSVPFSADYFRLLFKKEMGCTPIEYLNKIRLSSAMDLLDGNDRAYGLPVATIASMCGFADPLYFSRCFKKHTGMTPTAWMERKQDNE